MRAYIRVELIIGETTVQKQVIPLEIEFDNFKIKRTLNRNKETEKK
jgi:hypothetical protein